MSTRSGKRIHASSVSPTVDKDVTLQSERKPRNKKQKENIERSVKKRNNYVSYPADYDTPSVSSEAVETQEKTRKTRRNTLKELNLHVPLADAAETTNDSNTVRKTRRGKKLIAEPENAEDIVNIQNHAESETVANNKKRNKKKKTHKKDSIEATVLQDVKKQVIAKKGTKKKLKGLNPMNNDHQTEIMNGGINDTLDSFRSAAGSPVEINHVGNDCGTEVKVSSVGYLIEETIFTTDSKFADMSSSKITDITVTNGKKIEKNVIENIDSENLNTTFDKSPTITIASNTMAELATNKKRKTSIKNSTFDKIEQEANEDKLDITSDKIVDTPTTENTTIDLSLRKRKRSITKNTTIDNIQFNDSNQGNLNATFDKTYPSPLNTSVDASMRKRRKSSIKNSTFDKPETNETEDANDKCFNSTFDIANAASNVVNGNLTDNSDKSNLSVTFTPTQDNEKSNDTHKTSNSKRKSSVINTTYDKIEKDLECNEVKDANGTFDKDDGLQISLTNNKSLNRRKSSQKNNILNESEDTFTSNGERSSKGNAKTNNFDSAFNNDNNIKLNTTFDTEKKSEGYVDSTKSSLISSDATINGTFDKSGDYSRISLTSDESKTENILNHTPVLIESSIDESLMSEDKSPEKSEVPVTPLKREGTFTKEESNIVCSPPKPEESAEKTPVKRKSSPGCTPFPFSKISQKENAKLNVTRSIEKSLRKSSLSEVAPRQTRVMFCSPANNPAVVAQVKGRVIKSNLKGSNKSFVFDDSVSSESRAVRRKRSLTVGAAGAVGAADEAGTGAKRKRLGDDLQHSVDRLSRPRTQSAAAKLSEPGTPSKKATPCKAKEKAPSRTRLPNFAALHQKQFARMESLDECQRRRARRARTLLTPTGCVGLIERISPKGTPPKPAPAADAVKEPAKLHTPSKPKLPSLPTLDSLMPRYTRFGFKLNVDENPFSVAKTEAKRERSNDRTMIERPKDRTMTERPSRHTCLPSLAGAATGAAGARREAARQAVMREKSFSEKRLTKRDATRTVIKGVRTNRRFELQMKMRNINA